MGGVANVQGFNACLLSALRAQDGTHRPRLSAAPGFQQGLSGCDWMLLSKVAVLCLYLSQS